MQGNNFLNFLAKLKLSVSDVAKSLEISEAYVYKMRNGERPVSNSIAESLYKLYKVNPDYLLGNSTDMFLEGEHGAYSMKTTLPSEPANHKQIPYYEIEVSAGDMTFYQDLSNNPAYMIDIPIFNDCDLAMPVYGDSMYPKIKNGDIVLLKKIKDKSIISYGEIHLVVTPEQRLLKYVRKHSDKSMLKLLSENERYDEIEVERDKVKHLFIYKGKIEKSQI